MLTRRRLLQSTAVLSAFATLPVLASGRTELPKRAIPATGETIPLLGMGTWLTFDVADYPAQVQRRTKVLQTFLEGGGGLVDSSPMYGSSEQTVGLALRQLKGHASLFTATKVWTPTRWLGIQQMQNSMALWGVDRFDLMQVHNLLDWETHLETLKAWKDEGRIRYIGVTTSHGRRHEELERVMRREPLDFVQFTYNLLDREVESRLLPLASDQGIAVIINRPFRRAALLDTLANKPLPPWAGDLACTSWAQYCLKFILSHPHVCCAIPATTRVDHMQENLQAAAGTMPDQATRTRMAEYVASILS
ncbi:MAG: aldo/keto reductase [Candidatus Thiodiazotropha sp.]